MKSTQVPHEIHSMPDHPPIKFKQQQQKIKQKKKTGKTHLQVRFWHSFQKIS